MAGMNSIFSPSRVDEKSFGLKNPSKKGIFILPVCFLIIAFLSLSSAQVSSKTAIRPPVVSEKKIQKEWWEVFGTPRYGGELTTRIGQASAVAFDVANPKGFHFMLWYDGLFTNNSWTVDRAIQPFKGELVDIQYYSGQLAKSWEWTDPFTATVHLRQGVHWHNRKPVNGREFNSDDVVKHYDRLLGTGNGHTEPVSFFKNELADLERVIALDKYTVQFKFRNKSALNIYVVLASGQSGWMDPPELVEGGLLEDWENTIGTGPWMLTDFRPNISLTYTRNPDYWDYDPRHPRNQLPYLDSMKWISILDSATAVAATRTGKIDLFDSVAASTGPTWLEGKSLAKSNPGILQASQPTGGQCLEIRCDKEPFNDLRVRKALQMAIDLKAIAASVYGGAIEGTPCGLISPRNKGWALPFDKWPADLQQEYTYNPARARELLAEAGYPEGFKTHVMAFAEIELFEALKSMLADIGVDMEIKTMEFNTFFSILYSGKNDAMNQMNLVGGLGLPTNAFNRRTTTGRANFTHCNDSTFDTMIDQMKKAGTIEEAQRLSTSADQYALAQHWQLNILPYVTRVVWQPYIKGYSGESDIRYYSARIWSEKKEKGEEK